MIVDYRKQPLVVGDCIRNIESHWKGRIKVIHTDGRDGELECLGINFWDNTEDTDDRQWHSPSDVVKVPLKNGIKDPVNALNFM